MGDDDWKKGVCGSCCCVLTLIAIILFATSYSSLEQNEVGLDCNGITKVVDTKLWENGRHFLGLGHRFIKFPTSVQEDSVSLSARSKDGASVQLRCNFHWQVIVDERTVFQLWQSFDDGFHNVFQKIAKDDIRNVASEWSSFEWFFNRSAITNQMSDSLAVALEALGVRVSSFQLLNFDVPPAFADAITLTQEARQQISLAEAEQSKVNITVSTEIQTAREDANIVVVRANAEASAFVFQKQAERDNIITRIEAEAAAYVDLKQNLTLSSEELISFIWVTAMQESQAPATYNIEMPSELSFNFVPLTDEELAPAQREQ